MSQSLARNFVHIVFSTKHRQPLIHEPVQSELHRYLGGICKKMECFPVVVGGYRDHIHILCLLSKKIALMKFLEELKTSSSKWMKTKSSDLSNFYWQDGYGAFSVYPKDIDTVKTYIENQEQHHSKDTFQNEFRRILQTQNIPFDERYIWD